MAIRVRINSTISKVYFRAGLALAPGKSELAVSDEQCAALEADPRLVVERLAEDAALSAADAPQAAGLLGPAVDGVSLGAGAKLATGTLAGVVDHDGAVIPLSRMKVDELRELAVDMGIPGAADMKKADLVAAIAASDVQYAVGDESGTGEPAPQGEE